MPAHGTRCAVIFCKNTDNSSRARSSENRPFTFHKFPRDDQLRKIWIKSCRRGNGLNIGSARLCSDHFKEDDYELDFRAQLMALPKAPRRVLKKSAIPSLKLTASRNTDHDYGEKRSKRRARRNRKKVVADLISSSSSSTATITSSSSCSRAPIVKILSCPVVQVEERMTTPVIETVKILAFPVVKVEEHKSAPVIETVEILADPVVEIEEPRTEVISSENVSELALKFQNLQDDYNKLKYDHEQLQTYYTKVRLHNIQLQKVVGSCQVQLTTQNVTMRQLKRDLLRLRRSDEKDVITNQKIDSMLSKVFTKNQIKIIRDNKRRVNWTQEEISMAMTLRYLSKRAYLFLKKKFNFPLPGLSTLNHWGAASSK